LVGTLFVSRLSIPCGRCLSRGKCNGGGREERLGRGRWRWLL